MQERSLLIQTPRGRQRWLICTLKSQDLFVGPVPSQQFPQPPPRQTPIDPTGHCSWAAPECPAQSQPPPPAPCWRSRQFAALLTTPLSSERQSSTGQEPCSAQLSLVAETSARDALPETCKDRHPRRAHHSRDGRCLAKHSSTQHRQPFHLPPPLLPPHRSPPQNSPVERTVVELEQASPEGARHVEAPSVVQFRQARQGDPRSLPLHPHSSQCDQLLMKIC
mmetsp:Transcript_1545/g.2755  ORF Transcript_1545/g.2755 Transcript_1545/m.2755 type:complete len:222 (+) Transcript_1545:805-1470(+)